MKKTSILKRVKWENVVSIILYIIIGIDFITTLLENGFNSLELVWLLYQIAIVQLVHFIIKSKRKYNISWF